MIAVSLYLALFLLNALGFILFRIDKRRAEASGRRIAERHLLLVALAGGWFGAKAAQHAYHHKTRKQPFRTLLNAVPAVWGGVLFLLVSGTGDIPPVPREKPNKPPVIRLVTP